MALTVANIFRGGGLENIALGEDNLKVFTPKDSQSRKSFQYTDTNGSSADRWYEYEYFIPVNGYSAFLLSVNNTQGRYGRVFSVIDGKSLEIPFMTGFNNSAEVYGSQIIQGTVGKSTMYSQNSGLFLITYDANNPPKLYIFSEYGDGASGVITHLRYIENE